MRLLWSILLFSPLFIQAQEPSISFPKIVEVRVDDGIKFTLKQGEENAVLSDSNTMEFFNFKVKDSTLTISKKSSNSILKGDYSAFTLVVNDDLRHLILRSNVICSVLDELDMQELAIDVFEGSSIRGRFIVDNFGIYMSNGSDAELNGVIDVFKGTFNNNSICYAKDLVVDDCEINATTGSEVKISVNSYLDITTSLGALVLYYGNPSTKNIQDKLGGQTLGKS